MWISIYIIIMIVIRILRRRPGLGRLGALRRQPAHICMHVCVCVYIHIYIYMYRYMY